MRCRECGELFERFYQTIHFAAQKDGWSVDFLWLEDACWTCSFMEGFEAYAEYKLCHLRPSSE